MISKLIKKRQAKLSSRGLYLQDKELRETKFKIGQNFKYLVDLQKRQIRIVPTAEPTKNTVSKRSMKDGLKPVLDIRDRSALQAFQGADFLEIVILENEVIVRGLKEQKVRKTSLFSIEEYLKSKTIFNVRIDRDELAAVVGDSSFTSSQSLEQFSTQLREEIPLTLKTISLFSGAGVGDIGLYQSGFDVVIAIEKDEEAAETYRYNHGNHIRVTDIREFDKRLFATYHAPVMFGGSPCKGFTNVNRRTNFLDNPNNLLVREYIESVNSNPHAKVFVLENVPQILTAGNGQFLNEIKDALSDFKITYGVLNSEDFGDAQSRYRAFLIGSKIGTIPLPKPTVEAPQTVYEAFQGLHNGIPNQLDYSESRGKTIERMEHVPQGGNWMDLPENLKTNGMLKGNTQSNIYRRLKWDEPSCALVNVRKCLLTHPIENRILSVRESARLFSVPDDFIFKGSLESKQQQIANSIPVKMVKAVANQVKNAILNFNAKLNRQSLVLV